MRALIVLGGDAPGVGLLKACAAEADFSIAADRGLEAFDAAEIEPDMLIGDMDSVSPQVLARYESRLSADRLNWRWKRRTALVILFPYAPSTVCVLMPV